MRNGLLLAAVAAIGLLAVAATAQAHVTHESDDGAYFITIGQQGEPVYTFQRTNLDLIIRVNDNGERGEEVPGVNGTLTATLIAPGGEELQRELHTQSGTTGRYQFADAYTLTRPGIYTLRLEGTIGDTVVDGVYALPHEIHSQSDVMFPDPGLPTPLDVQELMDQVAALEARVQSIEAGIPDGNGGDNRDSPAPTVALILAALAAVALLARRRNT